MRGSSETFKYYYESCIICVVPILDAVQNANIVVTYIYCNNTGGDANGMKERVFTDFSSYNSSNHDGVVLLVEWWLN